MKSPFVFQIFFPWEAVWISELISHAEETHKCQEIMQSSILVITTRKDVVSHNDQVSFDTNEIVHKWSQIPCYSFLDCLLLIFKQKLSSKASWSQTIRATQTPFCLSDFVDAIWNDHPLGFIFASLHASAQIGQIISGYEGRLRKWRPSSALHITLTGLIKQSRAGRAFSPHWDIELTENETVHWAEAVRSHQRDWGKCVSPVAQGKDSSGWQGAKGQRELKAQWERPSEATRWRGGRNADNQPVTTKTSKALAGCAPNTEFQIFWRMNGWPSVPCLTDASGMHRHLDWSVLSQVCTGRVTLQIREIGPPGRFPPSLESCPSYRELSLYLAVPDSCSVGWGPSASSPPLNNKARPSQDAGKKVTTQWKTTWRPT